MLEMIFVRENPDAVRESMKKRGTDSSVVDKVLELDSKWRKLKGEADALRAERNRLTLEITKKSKSKEDAALLIIKAKKIPAELREKEKKVEELSEKINSIMMRIPNILHSSVPVGRDDSENKTVKKWGTIPKFSFELKGHGELLEELGCGDFKRAAKVSASGFYYLIGDVAILDLALQRFVVDVLVKKGYRLVEPPLMMNRRAYEGVTDLADFEKVMYKIDGEELYLIATSEHPIGAMFMDDVISEKDLPLRLAGVSPCFRREIGSHGVDSRGLFRVHHFNKVEQFVFCKPEDSWKIHEEMLENAEEIFRGLGISYRVVNVCTGDIGIIAAKKYDIEAWMPRERAYREVVSCSNCTSYQAVRLGVKYLKGQEREHVHTLNSTAIATGRAIRAILENFQQKDGSVAVPEVLHKYTGFKVIRGRK